eukprot:6399248-Prymnesium_polylepis.1
MGEALILRRRKDSTCYSLGVVAVLVTRNYTTAPYGAGQRSITDPGLSPPHPLVQRRALHTIHT